MQQISMSGRVKGLFKGKCFLGCLMQSGTVPQLRCSYGGRLIRRPVAGDHWLNHYRLIFVLIISITTSSEQRLIPVKKAFDSH